MCVSLHVQMSSWGRQFCTRVYHNGWLIKWGVTMQWVSSAILMGCFEKITNRKTKYIFTIGNSNFDTGPLTFLRRTAKPDNEQRPEPNGDLEETTKHQPAPFNRDRHSPNFCFPTKGIETLHGPGNNTRICGRTSSKVAAAESIQETTQGSRFFLPLR